MRRRSRGDIERRRTIASYMPFARGRGGRQFVVQTEIDKQYQGICRFWIPNRDAYRCLGQIDVDDERFKVNYETIAEGLAEYQRDVMVVDAEERLGE